MLDNVSRSVRWERKRGGGLEFEGASEETTKRFRFKRRRCVSSLCSLFSYGRGSNVERMTLREGNLVGSRAMIDGEELAHPNRQLVE